MFQVFALLACAELKVEQGRVDCAQTDAEMLLLEHDWYVFKDAICKLAQVIFALRHAFEFNIGVNVAQAARGLEFLWSTLLDQIAKH